MLSEDEEVLLQGRLNDGKSFLSALNCLASGRSKVVEVSAHPTNGVTFSAVIPGSVLSSVSIPARAFTLFSCKTARICLVLSSLTDCLSLPFADRPFAAVLELTRDQLLLTLLEEQGVVTECILRTQEGVSAALEGMRSAPKSPTIASAVLSSDILREALNELDYGNESTACLTLSINMPRLSLCSPDPARPSITVDFPDPLEGGQDCFDEFSCSKTIRATFRLEFLKTIVKPLAVCDVAKLIVDEIGVLSVVCKAKSIGYFHEIFIVPQEIMDSDDDEEMEQADVEH